jgi:hypothetical protein
MYLLIKWEVHRLCISAIITLTAIAAILIARTTAINHVHAGVPRHDYDERYDDVPGAPECWTH